MSAYFEEKPGPYAYVFFLNLLVNAESGAKLRKVGRKITNSILVSLCCAVAETAETVVASPDKVKVLASYLCQTSLEVSH